MLVSAWFDNVQPNAGQQHVPYNVIKYVDVTCVGKDVVQIIVDFMDACIAFIIIILLIVFLILIK